MLSGYGPMLGVASQNKKGESFSTLCMELEMEIAETRQELDFCKREVRMLTQDRNKVSEMAENKCEEINAYLNKELIYLEEQMLKAT